MCRTAPPPHSLSGTSVSQEGPSTTPRSWSYSPRNDDDDDDDDDDDNDGDNTDNDEDQA